MHSYHTALISSPFRPTAPSICKTENQLGIEIKELLVERSRLLGMFPVQGAAHLTVSCEESKTCARAGLSKTLRYVFYGCRTMVTIMSSGRSLVKI